MKDRIIALIKEVAELQSGIMNPDGEYVQYPDGECDYILDAGEIDKLAKKIEQLFKRQNDQLILKQ